MGAPRKHKLSAAAWVLASLPALAAAGEPGRSYAVMAFENRGGTAGMEWMRLAVPFSLAEKLEVHPGLRASYGTLVIPDGAPPAAVDADSVAAFAASARAELVWTGWLQRERNWDLAMGVTLWRVSAGKATALGEVTRRGDFKDVHAFTNDALRELCAAAGAPLEAPFAETVLRIPTRDYYAFTLFGRGLLALHGLGKQPHVTSARRWLAKAVFIDPSLAEAHRLLGVAYRWKGQTAKARGQFGYALELRPDYFAALAGQGRTFYDDGKLRPAQELFEKMLALRPWDVELRFDLGKLFWENGDVDAALAQLQRVVGADPNHLAARRILVLVHASRGEGEDLVSQLEAVRTLDPGDVETQLDLGAAYAAVGRDDDAIATYADVLEGDPEHMQALKFIGDLYANRGEVERAIEYYGRALAAHPRDPRPYFLLGRAYVDAGDDEAARKIYLRAQRFKEYLPETYNNLGSILIRKRQHAEARWYLKQAVKRRPDSARFRYNLALVYSVLRQVDDARAEIATGIELQPDHVGLHYLRGVLALRTGDADAARAAFERVVELDPAHDDARHNLALIEGMRRRAVDGEIAIELPQPGE
jgi:Flp pilus assembly protein TadD